MTLDEYRARLAEDAQQLEKALGDRFPHGKMAVQLMRTDFSDAGDCALDLAIEDAPVKDRVELQLLAQRHGYARPWNRDTGTRDRIAPCR